MALDQNNGLDINITGNSQKAEEAIKKIDQAAKTLEADLKQMTKTMEAAFTGNLNALAKKLDVLTKKQTALMRGMAGGDKDRQIASATTDRYIANTYTKTDTALLQKVEKARADAEIRSMRLSREATAAKIRQTGDQLDRMIISAGDDIRRATYTRFRLNNDKLTSQYNDPAYVAAMQRDADRKRAAFLQRDQNFTTYGQATAPTPQRGLFDSVNERFNSNGGADIMAIQARLMAGYAVLNMFFSTLRNGAAFIVQLDAELKQFQAITQTSATEMVGFKETLMDVAETSKFTAVELAQAATTMGQAGFTAKQVGETLGAVANLAAGSGSSLADALDVVTSTMSIFNLQTSQATDLANTLTSALNLSKLSIDKIALSMQYAGNIAAESGVSYKELLALTGTMANSGIMSGSTLGTGLRQLMIDIQNPTKKFKDALESVGLSEQDVSIKSKTLTGVLRTLHDAGFGTAQAFQSFEVRAASAFAALDGNLDSITDMVESLTNSSAATEASATQMESLANKWTRLGSATGNTIDKMFAGTLEVLKGIIDAATQLFTTLNEYPGLLKTIGTLMTAVFGAIVLQQISAGVVGLGTAILGMAGATNTARVGFLGLNLAMRANPLVLLITALVTVISLMGQFGSATENAAERMDRLKSEVNEAKGDVDATVQTIRSLNETSKQLMDQRSAMDADPVLRKSRVMEIVDAFKELALEIDSSSASAEKLIEAVDRLTKKQMEVKQIQLGVQQSAQQRVVDEQRAQLMNQLQSTNAATLMTNLPRDDKMSIRRSDEYINARQQNDLGTTTKLISDAYKKNLTDQFDPLVDQALGISAVTDLNELIAKTGQLKEAMLALPEGSEMRDTYAALLSALEAMIPLQKTFNEQESALTKIKKEQAAVTVQISPQYTAINDDARKAIANTIQFRDNALSGDSPFSKDQQIFEIEKEKDNFQNYINSLKAKAEEAGGEVLKNFESQILPALNEQIGIMNQIVSKNSEDYFKRREREMKRSGSIMSTRLNTLVSRSGKALTEDMVQALMDELIELYRVRREMIKKIFGEKIDLAQSDSERQQLEDERASALTDLSAEETQKLNEMLGNIDKLKKEKLENLKKNLDDQIAAISTKIDENVEQLKRLNPGAAFDKLKASTQLLIDQLATLGQQSSTTGLQINNPAQFSGQYKAVTSDANAQARQAQIMSLYMQAGYTKEQAAGVVGHFMQESGVRNDGPLGDGGLAMGLAQWHPDRQARLFQYLKDNNMENTLENQGRFSIYELQKYYPKVDAQLRGAGTVEDATRAFAGYEGFKDWNKPTLHAQNEYTARINNALGAYSVDQSRLATADRQQSNLDQAGYKNINDVANQKIDEMDAALKTQLSQVKIGGDPAKILSMQKNIDDELAAVIEEKTKAFKETNPGVDPSTDAEFQSKIKELQQTALDKTTGLMSTYWDAVEKEGEKNVKLAELRLSEAQKQPEGTYTGDQMAKLQNDVTVAQRVAQQQQLAAATQLAARANQEAANAAQVYGQNSEQVRYWTEQEAQAKQKAAEITQQKNAADAATAQQGPSVAAAIQNANQQWAIQNGLMQRAANGSMQMVPLATQVGNKWGEVLTGMSDNLATLFTNLASGTMSAKDAMKQFALSTVQMFIQMISKALAYQLIMSTIGKSTGGGGLLTGLLGVPGMQGGGGIPGAAAGEMITGGIPNRDSVLRKVEPGEFILRKSAVQQLGKKNVSNMNAMGNRRLSVPGNPFAENGQKREPSTTNVWVVSPDQQPQMGPNDIVAIVADNIQRRGSIKRLIKSVQNGE